MKLIVSFLLLLPLLISLAWGSGSVTTVTNGKTIVIDDDIDLSDPRIRAMTLEANQMLTDIATVCAKWRLKNDGAADFRPDSASDDDKFYQSLGTSGFQLMQLGGPQITASSDRCTFTFGKMKHELISYQSKSLLDLANIPSSSMQTQDVAHWSASHAIEIASAFKAIFAPHPDVDLGPPTAYFDKSSMHGTWCVTWKRTDHEGHPFFDDQMNIWLKEGHAPTEFEAKLATPFMEVTGEPISQAKAIANAKESDYARQKISRLATLGISARLAQGDASLKIVPVADRENRLSWVIWFVLVSSEKQALHPFAIWVDAHTGKAVGTESMPTPY